MNPARRRQLALIALAVALFVLLGVPQAPSGTEVVAATPRVKPARAASGGVPVLLALEARGFEAGGEWFRVPPPPKPAPEEVLAAQRASELAAEPPRPPPVPFRYMGVVVRAGKATALLRIQERDFVVQAGEVVEGAYRVNGIEPTAVQLTYLPLSAEQSVPLYEPQPVNVSEVQ